MKGNASFSDFIKDNFNNKLFKNILFFLLLIIFTFWYIFRNQDINKILSLLGTVDVKYVLLGILLMLGYYIVETHNIRCLLTSIGNKKIPFLKMLKFTFIGFFFSSITPAASGGQPVEIYYMTKEKISGANAALALMTNVCCYQIVTLALGIICCIINPIVVDSGLLWLFIIGATINGSYLLFITICIFSDKLKEKLCKILFKILKFFKVKELDYKIKKIEEGINQYKKGSAFIKKNKIELVKSVFRVFIQMSLYYLIPYCVYKAFGLNGYNIFEIYTIQAVLFTTVSCLPLPGAIGVSETVFLELYGPVFSTELLSSAMLLSRGISFYLFVIVSMIITIINAATKKKIVGEIDERIIQIDKEFKTSNKD